MKNRALATLGLCLTALSGVSALADAPLWLRDVAVSPDGSTIAFTYRGDIYTVPFGGGAARRITSDAAFDSSPVWSPDGSRIAFASDREGTDDVYIVDALGGTPVRLTTDNTGAEVPKAFVDTHKVLYAASAKPSREAAQGPFQGQMYVVDDTAGARPKMYLSLPMTYVDVNPSDGMLIYQNRKGYEDVLRKHERSSGTPDIYSYNPKDGKFTRLTDFIGACQNPVWAGPGAFFYLNDSDGNNNVYLRSTDGKEKRLTSFANHPVRSLSADDSGKLLAFSQDGQVYTMKVDNSGNVTSQPAPLGITIVADNYDPDLVKNIRNSGATNMAVSPDGSQVAFVIRGDVYVTSAKYKTTRRITDTPGQERTIAFSPDGKTLVYDGERDGLWRIYTATMNPNDTVKGFPYASEIIEKMVYESPDRKPAQQPAFSPDGKKIAFLEDRTGLRVLDLASGKTVTALDPKYNYSYSDGDVPFQWSPDSRHILISFIGEGGWNNSDIAMVNADGTGEPFDLTVSGYSNYGPQWTSDGGGITFMSAKQGYRSHGSWGEQHDIYLMMLDPEKWDKFNMTEEEIALAEKIEKEAEPKDADKKKKKDSKKEASKKEKLNYDLANRLYRTKRLTPVSGFIGDYRLSPKSDRVYYTVKGNDGKYDLMMADLKKGSTTRLLSDLSGGFDMDAKGENLFVISGEGIKCVTLPTGEGTSATVKNIEFEADYTRVPSAEREYIYDHVLSQVNDKFYDENLHGVDWKMYGEAYRKFLPYIDNNRDFATLLSELLGELNASHTGGRAYGNGAPASVRAASLGAFYDENYDGDGLKVAEVLPRSPLASAKANVKSGDVITAIDGEKIKKGADYNSLLEGKAGKNTRVTIARKGGATDVVTIRPISAGDEREMLYQRWVEHNRHVVDSVSGGRVAYVHVRGMDSESFRTVYDELLGAQRNRDAVVVDTRYNGGGWLHNDIAILLSGKEYVRFNPRGRYIGSEPFSQWTKPSVMLINESNYSDAHGTPYTYKTLNLGKLVGAPVPGTMTAVWWETQVDPSLVFGIPQVTSLDTNGKPLENQQLNPDVEVYNEPADVLRGIDTQLIRATQELMSQIKK